MEEVKSEVFKTESDITKKYSQMLSDLEKVDGWSQVLASENEMLNEPDFWHCCIRLQHSLDELINTKNKKK